MVLTRSTLVGGNLIESGFAKKIVPRFFAVTPTGELMIKSGESFGKVFATRPALQK